MNYETIVLHKFTRGNREVKVCQFCCVENAMTRSDCFICGRSLEGAFVANDYTENDIKGPFPDPAFEEATEPLDKDSAEAASDDIDVYREPDKRSRGNGWIIPVAIVGALLIVAMFISIFEGTFNLLSNKIVEPDFLDMQTTVYAEEERGIGYDL